MAAKDAKGAARACGRPSFLLVVIAIMLVLASAFHVRAHEGHEGAEGEAATVEAPMEYNVEGYLLGNPGCMPAARDESHEKCNGKGMWQQDKVRPPRSCRASAITQTCIEVSMHIRIVHRPIILTKNITKQKQNYAPLPTHALHV